MVNGPIYSHLQPPYSGYNLPDIAGLTNTLVYQAALSRDHLTNTTAGWFPPTEIKVDWPTVPAPPIPIQQPTPTVRTVTWTTPVAPAPGYGDLNVDGYIPPEFTALPPTLQFGTAPTASFGSQPAAPTVDVNFAMPTLDYRIPDAPQLMALETVRFDGVTLPTFEATEPTLRLAEPTVMPYHEGAGYTSTLLDLLKADLTRAMTDGTWTGLSASAERALWDRARERELRAQREAIDQLDRMESTGFALPPGVWLDARVKIITETNNTIVGLSREIMIKQAELQLANITKSREVALQLEGKLIDYANNVAQRAFEATRFQTQAMLDIYNAGVRAYEAAVTGYRAKAEVYNYQVRGALAIAEVYKTQIDAERAKAEMNVAAVQAYKAQVDAAMANVDIFRAKLQALETQANLQKLKVEVYGEEIRAYTGRIGAYTAEVEAYKAGVQAQAVGMDAYKSRVEAYKAQVEANTAAVQVRIEAYKGKIAGYHAQIDGYKAGLDAMVAEARATAEYNTSQAEVFRAQVSGTSAYNDALTRQWSASVEISARMAELGAKVAEANIQRYVQMKNVAVEAAKGAAVVSAQLGSAALNAVHYSQSVSFASSGTQSYAASDSKSEVESKSV